MDLQCKIIRNNFNPPNAYGVNVCNSSVGVHGLGTEKDVR